MIYLDNSATTFPKPPQVSMAMSRAMTKFGANPGRSGHAMSIAAAEEIFKCREAAASFFHADGPEIRGISVKLFSGHQYGVKRLCQTGRPHCNLLFGAQCGFSSFADHGRPNACNIYWR